MDIEQPSLVWLTARVFKIILALFYTILHKTRSFLYTNRCLLSFQLLMASNEIRNVNFHFISDSQIGKVSITKTASKLARQPNHWSIPIWDRLCGGYCVAILQQGSHRKICDVDSDLLYLQSSKNFDARMDISRVESSSNRSRSSMKQASI